MSASPSSPHIKLCNRCSKVYEYLPNGLERVLIPLYATLSNTLMATINALHINYTYRYMQVCGGNHLPMK